MSKTRNKIIAHYRKFFNYSDDDELCDFTDIDWGEKLINDFLEINDKDLNNCLLCGTPTDFIMNINLKAVHVCNSCANSIMLQQAQFLTRTDKS